MSRPSIVCAIDFTRASDEALRVAIEEANRRDAILDIVHVWMPVDVLPTDIGGVALPPQDYETPKYLEARLDAISIPLPPDRVRRHLFCGSTADQIVDAVNEFDSELLVLGTHNRGVIKRWFLGSVTSALLRVSPCPVLVCREPHDGHEADAGRDENDSDSSDASVE